MRMVVRRPLFVFVITVMLGAGCSSSDDEVGKTAPAPVEAQIFFEGHTSEVYSADDHWLCRPDLADDPCTRDLDATVIAADGSLEVEPFVAADDPAFECFYVYTTVRTLEVRRSSTATTRRSCSR